MPILSSWTGKFEREGRGGEGRRLKRRKGEREREREKKKKKKKGRREEMWSIFTLSQCFTKATMGHNEDIEQ